MNSLPLRRCPLAVLLALAVAVSLSAQSAPAGGRVTSEQVHAHMMQELGLKSIRPGADPNRGSTHLPNYNEALATPYKSLPNPLVMANGKPVTTRAEWWKVQRPWIMRQFSEDIYGFVPKDVPKVHWVVDSLARRDMDGIPVITKHITGHVDNSRDPAITVNLDLTETVPANAAGPVPVMIDFGFNFSPAMLARFRAMMKARKIKLPPPPKGPSWQQQLINAGWGYAVFVPTSAQADNGAGLRTGIIGLTNRGRPRTPSQWGALRAWAWGASRALDYLSTDKRVNAREVGIEGLSRYGKATIVTMAYDQRFAIALVGSAGKGGDTLYRRHFGEEMGNLAGAGEFHWFDGNFLKYDGPLTAENLPVDAHELIAACAPRPVFISTGNPPVESYWVDATGMYIATVQASPVYRFLGGKGLVREGLPGNVLPPLGSTLTGGNLAFRDHHGGHTDVPNWPYFIKWAGRYIHAPKLLEAKAGAAGKTN